MLYTKLLKLLKRYLHWHCFLSFASSPPFPRSPFPLPPFPFPFPLPPCPFPLPPFSPSPLSPFPLFFLSNVHWFFFAYHFRRLFANTPNLWEFSPLSYFEIKLDQKYIKSINNCMFFSPDAEVELNILFLFYFFIWTISPPFYDSWRQQEMNVPPRNTLVDW